MFTDLVELTIDIVDFIVNRGWIMRFFDDLAIALNTAITFLPRIGLVLGYVSYFVDWPLILPLLLLALAAILCRLAFAVIALLHSILDSIPIIG